MEAVCLLFLAVFLSQALGGSSCPPGCQSCENEQFICTGLGLQEIPNQVPQDTQILDMSQNEISRLQKKTLKNLQSVQSLRLAGNLVTSLRSNIFESMPQMMSLDLSNNRLSAIADDALAGLSGLQTISLSANQLQQIGMMFSSTPAVTSLRLGGNQIQNVEKDDFKENTMLRMLDLSNNEISSIHSEAFSTLQMLQYLVLSNNPLTTLSDLVFSSTKLSLADFSNCQLTAVPRTMPPSLQDFRLGNNRITSIEVDDFRNITRLRLVILNDNNINAVAYRAFEGLEKLREIWLTRNDLVYIPRGLPQGLEKLYMDFNQVVEFQPMSFHKDSQLKFLTLESNRVRKLHQEAFKDVKLLEELNLQGNKFSLIDIGTFTELPELKTLRLSSNPLQSLEPRAFENLDSLTTLTMSYIDHQISPEVHILKENFFRTMPSLAFIDMTSSPYLVQKLLELISDPSSPVFPNIKHLNLQYNDLQTLPENLRKVLPNVQELILDGNVWKCDRNLAWLHEWITTADTMFYSMDEPVCETPSQLQGRSLSSLSDLDFVEVAEEKTVQSETPNGSYGQINTEPAAGERQESSNTAVAVPSEDDDTQPAAVQESNLRPVFGTRVVIKPSQSKPDSDPEETPKKKSKRTNKKRKGSRKGKKKRNKGKGDKGNRKKRRIRKDRSKRCKIQPDGSLKCRRRKGKGRKKDKARTTSPDTITM